MIGLGKGLPRDKYTAGGDPYPTPLYYREEDFTAADVTELSSYVVGGTLSLGTADVGGKSNYLILTVSTDDTPARLSIPGHAPTILAAPQSQYPDFLDLSYFYLDTTQMVPTENFDGNSAPYHGVTQNEGVGNYGGSSTQGTWQPLSQQKLIANSGPTIFYNMGIADDGVGDSDPQSGDKLYISKILIRWAPFGETPADP